jgi:hypothetical protein
MYIPHHLFLYANITYTARESDSPNRGPQQQGGSTHPAAALRRDEGRRRRLPLRRARRIYPKRTLRPTPSTTRGVRAYS